MSTEFLVTPALAAPLPPCCRPASPLRLSPWILSADLAASRDAAGLCCVAWSCRASKTKRHSQWIPRVDLVPAERVFDADAALGTVINLDKTGATPANPSVELWQNRGGCGRFVTASRPLRPGDCALRATAFAVIVRQTRERCHWCFAPLKEKAFQCADCQFARYCSRECLSFDGPLHDFQCSALKAVAARQSQAEARGIDALNCPDWEAVRLMLAVLSMEALLGHSEVLSRLVTSNQSWTSESETAKEAVRVISTKTPVRSKKRILQTLRRVQCNAHPMYLESNAVCGVGIFPEAAMALNHSCVPNVVPSFDPQTRTLSFHAISDIPKGHAVEYAYVDVMQSREQRQRLLLDGFGFRCACVRCFEEGPSDEPDSVGSGQGEKAVVMRLMEMNAAPQLPQSELDRVYEAHCRYFEQHDDAAFAFRMLALKHARARRDWARVIASAEALAELWVSKCALPEMHPTMESLYSQITVAAAQLGLAEKAERARQLAEKIHRICGYQLHKEPSAP